MTIQRIGRAIAWLTMATMALATGLTFLVSLALADHHFWLALRPWHTSAIPSLVLLCVLPLLAVLAALLRRA